jgi:hypothetical protein
MAVADFNHDGKPDLAVLDSGCTTDGSNCGAPGLSILLGNGNGTFQAALPLDPNDYPIDLVAADFNGDGKVDLAVQQIGVQGAYVALYLGNGDGTFRAGMQFQIGHESYAGLTDIVVGDFNRDGKLDLAVTDSYTSSVAILLGNGDATFQIPIEYPTGTQPTAIAAGDFNGDGILDLATLSGKTGVNTASVLLGNGDGTFQTYVDYGVGNGPTSLAATDLNGDGKLDLAIVDRVDNKVLVLLGNGDGTFLVDQGFPIGLGGGEIVAADFNGDGRMDIATANYLDNTASVLMQVLPGSQSAASLSASSLTFASQPVGSTSASQTVTLSNAGTAALAITSVAASGDFAQTNTCATGVAAGGTCTITVTFKPMSSGPRTGALSISDNAYNSPQTVSLSGTGEDFSFAPPFRVLRHENRLAGPDGNLHAERRGRGGIEPAHHVHLHGGSFRGHLHGFAQPCNARQLRNQRHGYRHHDCARNRLTALATASATLIAAAGRAVAACFGSGCHGLDLRATQSGRSGPVEGLRRFTHGGVVAGTGTRGMRWRR